MSESRKFRVLIGMNYGKQRREPGDIVTDLPDSAINGLLRQKAIEEIKPKQQDKT